MKVAILVSGLPPQNVGGAEISALELAKCAVKKGHEIHIITIGDYPKNIDGVYVHGVKTVNRKYLRSLVCCPAILATIKEVHPDVIHAQSVYMSPSAILATKIFHIPYWLYERGSVDMDINVNKYIYPVAMRSATRVVAQTWKQKFSLERFYKRDIDVIPNGVDISRFGKVAQQEAREILGLPKKGKIVLSVGRCRPEKNLADFVLASSGVNAHFVLVGDGEKLDTLKQMNKDMQGEVIFAGGIGNNKVPLYMSAADVLVNTSWSEGFPMSVLEGMASGLPIVAPDVCGISEIVRDGISGYLTIPHDFHSTRDAIQKLLSDTETRLAMGICNRAKASYYTWENVVDMLYGTVVKCSNL